MKVRCPDCEEEFQVAKKDKLESYECPDCGAIFKLKDSHSPLVFPLPENNVSSFNQALRKAYREFRPDDSEAYEKFKLDEDDGEN